MIIRELDGSSDLNRPIIHDRPRMRMRLLIEGQPDSLSGPGIFVDLSTSLFPATMDNTITIDYSSPLHRNIFEDLGLKRNIWKK